MTCFYGLSIWFVQKGCSKWLAHVWFVKNGLPYGLLIWFVHMVCSNCLFKMVFHMVYSFVLDQDYTWIINHNINIIELTYLTNKTVPSIGFRIGRWHSRGGWIVKWCRQCWSIGWYWAASCLLVKTWFRTGWCWITKHCFVTCCHIFSVCWS